MITAVWYTSLLGVSLSTYPSLYSPQVSLLLLLLQLLHVPSYFIYAVLFTQGITTATRRYFVPCRPSGSYASEPPVAPSCPRSSPIFPPMTSWRCVTWGESVVIERSILMGRSVSVCLCVCLRVSLPVCLSACLPVCRLLWICEDIVTAMQVPATEKGMVWKYTLLCYWDWSLWIHCHLAFSISTMPMWQLEEMTSMTQNLGAQLAAYSLWCLYERICPVLSLSLLWDLCLLPLWCNCVIFFYLISWVLLAIGKMWLHLRWAFNLTILTVNQRPKQQHISGLKYKIHANSPKDIFGVRITNIVPRYGGLRWLIYIEKSTHLVRTVEQQQSCIISYSFLFGTFSAPPPNCFCRAFSICPYIVGAPEQHKNKGKWVMLSEGCCLLAIYTCICHATSKDKGYTSYTQVLLQEWEKMLAPTVTPHQEYRAKWTKVHSLSLLLAQPSTLYPVAMHPAGRRRSHRARRWCLWHRAPGMHYSTHNTQHTTHNICHLSSIVYTTISMYAIARPTGWMSKNIWHILTHIHQTSEQAYL